jgi:fermentation-respiration switch protein FrsA (DUF1100 family)
MTRFITPAVTLCLALAAYWALLFLTQRGMMYPAPTPAGAPPRPPEAKQVWLATPAGSVEAWYLPPSGSPSGPAPLLLFTHGNGELIDYWPDAFDPPRQWGYGVLLLEYPGYGRSQGKPAETSITAATLAAFDWAASQPEIDSARIVGYGRSLGAGAICAILDHRPVAGLILESPFTTIRAFAIRYGAPGFLVRDPFDNVSRLRRYRGPILILHGEHDAIIPPAHSRKLAATAPRAELRFLPCGHNDCPRAWELVRPFLRRHGL